VVDVEFSGMRGDEIIALAEFTMAASLTISVGSQVPLAVLEDNTKCQGFPFRPLFSSIIMSSTINTLQVAFNSERNGWHYGWVSTPQTNSSLHSFRVYIFQRRGTLATCIAINNSTPFTLISRRRARFVHLSEFIVALSPHLHYTGSPKPHQVLLWV
jgi:hypothetical protein